MNKANNSNWTEISSGLSSHVDLLEFFLVSTGNTWILETIYLYTVTPFGVIAIFLNLICLLTFFKFSKDNSSSSSAQTKYSKVFTLNSIFLSSMIFLFIFTHIPRYFPFSLSYLARFYRCVLMINIANMLNFYESILNILIILDRMTNFVLKFQCFKNIPPFKASIICLISCIFVCLPTFYLSEVKSQSEFDSQIQNQNQYNQTIFRYCERTAFSQSTLGRAIIAVVIVIMNGLTLSVEVACTLMVIVYFRRYLESRSNLVAPKNKAQNLVAQQNKPKKMGSLEKNLTKMSIRFAILSSISNICILFYNLFVLFIGDNNTFYYYLVFCACLFTLIKLSANFFFFYYFNRHFRETFHSTFGFFKSISNLNILRSSSSVSYVTNSNQILSKKTSQTNS